MQPSTTMLPPMSMVLSSPVTILPHDELDATIADVNAVVDDTATVTSTNDVVAAVADTSADVAATDVSAASVKT